MHMQQLHWVKRVMTLMRNVDGVAERMMHMSTRDFVNLNFHSCSGQKGKEKEAGGGQEFGLSSGSDPLAKP